MIMNENDEIYEMNGTVKRFQGSLLSFKCLVSWRITGNILIHHTDFNNNNN
jgi:hypothetical protein